MTDALLSRLQDARAKAWATRRAKYGERGHGGGYGPRGPAERGALGLVIALMNEGVLSEGQVCQATKLDRVTVRVMADNAIAAKEGT